MENKLAQQHLVTADGNDPANQDVKQPGETRGRVPVGSEVYPGQVHPAVPGPGPGPYRHVQATGNPIMVSQPQSGHAVSPHQVQMVAVPQSIPGCPPGLEYLVQLDQVLIHQQIEVAEVLLNIDFQNKYEIKNSLGQRMYFAAEESEFCMRYLCGRNRGFVFHVTDNLGREVLRLVREFKCCAGCSWCADNDHCAFFIAVESPPGNVIGYVRQTKSWFYPHFDILMADQQCALKIRGPWLKIQGICCTDDIEFKVMDNNLTTQIGRVSKQWGGFAREVCTKADNFGVQFPVDLDVKLKATVMASAFLIDFMFFERQKRK